MILYSVPDKEKDMLDYRPLPPLHSLNLDELGELSQNIKDTMATAYIYHSDLLESALYDDLCKLGEYIETRKAQQEKSAAMGNR